MTEPGWYTDRDDKSLARWHDGERFTEHTIVMAEHSTPPPPPGQPLERAFPAAPLPPPPAQPEMSKRDYRAENAALAAKAKALRPWWKKKRIMIPLVVLVIAIAAAAAGSEDDKDKTTTAGTADVQVTDRDEPATTTTADPFANETSSQRQARRSAKSYIEMSAFSRTGLIKQLQFEKFSEADATYGVDSLGADWNEQAAKSARTYLDMSSFSRGSLIDQLKFEGFTQAEAEYGATAAGL